MTIDESVIRAVKVRAARNGQTLSEGVERALRRTLGLDVLNEVGRRNGMTEQDALALALDAQHSGRRRPQSS